jgi:CHAT domain-containing protein
MAVRLDHALIAAGRGDVPLAARLFQEASQAVEARRLALSHERFRRALGCNPLLRRIDAEHAAWLARSGDWDGAFALSERARARSAVQLVARRAGLTSAPPEVAAALRSHAEASERAERLTSMLANEARRGNAATPRTAELSALRAEALREVAAREVALAESAPRQAVELGVERSLVSAGGLRAALNPGTLVLAYDSFGERLLAWAYTAEGLVASHEAVRFAGDRFRARSFAAAVAGWSHEIGAGAEEAAHSRDLGDLLLAPFAAAIEAAERVIFVPHGALNLAPLHVLAVNGIALGLQKVVSYLPAASLLPLLRHGVAAEGPALVVGDPAGMALAPADGGAPFAMPRLPAARVEAAAVALAHGVEPLLDAAATEDAVRRALGRRPRLLHVATHVAFERDAPLASSIVLAAGDVLTAEELVGLDLDGCLVVLSGCDSGQGALRGGEVVGLARGLLVAGARAAVVSFWSSSDVAALLLMAELEARLAGGQPAAAALREAQRCVHALSAAEAIQRLACMEGSELAAGGDHLGLRASLRWCTGDVQQLAGDLEAAARSFDAATDLFRAAGRDEDAAQLATARRRSGAVRTCRSAPDLSAPVFAAPRFWAPFFLVGDPEVALPPPPSALGRSPPREQDRAGG